MVSENCARDFFCQRIFFYVNLWFCSEMQVMHSGDSHCYISLNIGQFFHCIFVEIAKSISENLLCTCFDWSRVEGSPTSPGVVLSNWKSSVGLRHFVGFNLFVWFYAAWVFLLWSRIRVGHVDTRVGHADTRVGHRHFLGHFSYTSRAYPQSRARAQTHI